MGDEGRGLAGRDRAEGNKEGQVLGPASSGYCDNLYQFASICSNSGGREVRRWL